MNKKEYIEKLKNSELYKSALASAKTEEEQKMIASISEGFLSTFLDALRPIEENISKEQQTTKTNDKVVIDDKA